MSTWTKVEIPAELPHGWIAEAYRPNEVLITAVDEDGRALGSITVDESVRGFALGCCQVRSHQQMQDATGRGWKQRLYEAAIAELERAITWKVQPTS